METTERLSDRIAELERRLSTAAGGEPPMLDLGDLRRLVRELQDRQERLQAALTGSGAGTFRWDIATGALEWDAELDRLFGLPPGETARSLDAFVARVHPDDRDAVRAACARCAADGADFEMEFRVCWPDGTERWLYDRGRTYRDAADRPAYMTGACIDVTERRSAVARLAASEERLRLAQEAGGVGTFEWFPDTDLVIASEQYHRLWGLPPDREIRGADLVALLHPDDRPLSGPARRGELASALDYVEYRVRRPDTGETRWLARRGQLMTPSDGGRARMVGVIYDVTDRKRAERRLAIVLDSIADGFVAVDGEWHITLFNDAAERHFGIGRDAALGCLFWDLFDYALGSEIEDHLRRAMTERRSFAFEAASIRRPGRIVETKVVAKEDGGLALTFADITERRQAERHRELLVNELNHRVKNTLAIVQAIAQQTLRGADVSPGVRTLFEGRLGALARAHDILTRRNWDAIDLAEVLRRALEPFDPSGTRIVADGPAVLLPARTAVSFALATHELATNAAKYGALQGDGGRVDVQWRVTDDGDGARLRFEWTERGGPPVAAAPRRGFGSQMVERALSADLRGTVRLDFAPEGVMCTIDAPLPELAG